MQLNGFPSEVQARVENSASPAGASYRPSSEVVSTIPVVDFGGDLMVSRRRKRQRRQRDGSQRSCLAERQIFLMGDRACGKVVHKELEYERFFLESPRLPVCEWSDSILAI